MAQQVENLVDLTHLTWFQPYQYQLRTAEESASEPASSLTTEEKYMEKLLFPQPAELRDHASFHHNRVIYRTYK